MTVETRHLCTYRALLESAQHDTGAAHFGRRMIAVVTSGEFQGDRLKGRVLSGGGVRGDNQDETRATIKMRKPSRLAADVGRA